jgi:hypothetical protein
VRLPGPEPPRPRTSTPQETHMGSNAKKKTTMGKLNRENAVRERRLRKQARKDARKQAAAEGATPPAETPAPGDA